MSLFDDDNTTYEPLAAKMRPRTLDEFVGQEHLLAPGKPLREAIEHSALHSMIFWGPPGTGKTTLARMISTLCEVHFHAISAVLAGVKDIREAIDLARQQRQATGRKTLLFVDEVHRFNKAQQDAFLPFVEDGTVIFAGATTENPSFELNNALLSRARIYKLQSLSQEVIVQILKNALADTERGMGHLELTVGDDELDKFALSADGDGRRALNLLEVAGDLATEGVVGEEIVAEVLGADHRRFDKGGDIFYEQISALHKAVRGSSPDAALYWLARMLDGGCDPLYIARRVVRMASEDIGNADPRALQLALNAWDVQERLGSPEGELAIAQAVVYLAVAAKSNAVYDAFGRAMEDAAREPSREVPLHIRNAPTKMMEGMGYGRSYHYAHDFDDAFVPGESYFPPELDGRVYYEPVQRGLETRIAEKLAALRKLNSESEFRRYGNDARDNNDDSSGKG